MFLLGHAAQLEGGLGFFLVTVPLWELHVSTVQPSGFMLTVGVTASGAAVGWVVKEESRTEGIYKRGSSVVEEVEGVILCGGGKGSEKLRIMSH